MVGEGGKTVARADASLTGRSIYVTDGPTDMQGIVGTCVLVMMGAVEVAGPRQCIKDG